MTCLDELLQLDRIAAKNEHPFAVRVRSVIGDVKLLVSEQIKTASFHDLIDSRRILMNHGMPSLVEEAESLLYRQLHERNSR